MKKGKKSLITNSPTVCLMPEQNITGRTSFDSASCVVISEKGRKYLFLLPGTEHWYSIFH